MPHNKHAYALKIAAVILAPVVLVSTCTHWLMGA